MSVVTSGCVIYFVHIVINVVILCGLCFGCDIRFYLQQPFVFICLFFFFKQKTAYEMRMSDWSSDVCSSDLTPASAQEIGLDHAAAAVELIHAYSLIHDDLPCMDDDTLRRGRPTVHVCFNEATAMLAGDALQPLAFELLGLMPIAPALIVQATQLLARSAGSLGMVGGQAIDCESVGVALSKEQLQQMHSMKTGAMLEASVLLGGIVAGARSAVRQGLEDYATAIGLAFQVVDDILAVTADTVTQGNNAVTDAAGNKTTKTRRAQ